MAEPQDALIEDLKKALHQAEKNNRPQEARQIARLLTEALNPTPQQPHPHDRTRSDSGDSISRILPGWPLSGVLYPKERR